MCRSDGLIGLSSTRTSASPGAKGGVGISASFNTLFGSPASLKINALIDTPWAFRRRAGCSTTSGTRSRAGDEEKHLRRTWEMLHPFARPLYILAAWAKLFAATRSKRKFNNPVSFDEKRPYRRFCHRRWLMRIATRVPFDTRFPLGRQQGSCGR